MQKNEITGREKSSIACYIFVLFIIFATDSMITISINSNITFYYGFRLLAIILCPILFLQTINIVHADRKWVLLISTYAISLALTIIVNRSFAFVIPLKFIYFLLGYCIVKYFGADKILRCFVHIMVLIAVISLIAFALSLISTEIFKNFPTITVVAQKSKRVSKFANLIFTVILTESIDMRPRNYGIFSEPGMYQVYIVFTLLIVLYGKFKKRKLLIVIMLLAIISTFSTTGYIVVALLLFTYYITNKEISNKNKCVGIVAAIIMLIAVMQNEYIYNMVFDKLKHIGNSSTISRLYSFPVNFWIWLKNPIVGVGAVNIDMMSESFAYSMTGSSFFHNTNTFMYTLGCYGIFVFGIEIWKTYVLAKIFSKRSRLGAFCIFVIIFICFSGENLTNSLAIETLLFCGVLAS